MDIELIKRNKKAIYGAVFVIVIISAVFVFLNKKSSDVIFDENQPGIADLTPTSTIESPSKIIPKKYPPSVISGSEAKRSAISMVMPVAGEVFLLNKTHNIRWSKGETRVGQMILVDAATKETIGWITPTIAPYQIAYDWDTTYVSISRNDPSRKSVMPGNYYIKVIFDTSESFFESGVFTLINSGEEKILTNIISVTNNIFMPYLTSVNKGNHIIMINTDNKNYTIKRSGFFDVVVSPTNSYVFKTGDVLRGIYEFRLAENAIAKLIVTVE